MKLTFFDILKDILLKQNGKLNEEPEFTKIFSSYMLVRYLSMKDNLIEYANKINGWQKILTPEDIYFWAYKNIPKQKSGFIKYIKKDKKKD